MRREILAVLFGGLSGMLLGGLVALASIWLSGGTETVSSDWSWTYVALVALAGGAPVGAASAFIADRAVLAPVRTAPLLRRLPVLFACAFAGSLPGLIHPLIPLLTAPLSLIAGAAWVRQQTERSGTSP